LCGHAAQFALSICVSFFLSASCLHGCIAQVDYCPSLTLFVQVDCFPSAACALWLTVGYAAIPHSIDCCPSVYVLSSSFSHRLIVVIGFPAIAALQPTVQSHQLIVIFVFPSFLPIVQLLSWQFFYHLLVQHIVQVDCCLPCLHNCFCFLT